MKVCLFCGHECQNIYCGQPCGEAYRVRRSAAVLYQSTCCACEKVFEATRPERMYCEYCAKMVTEGRRWVWATCRLCSGKYAARGENTKFCGACYNERKRQRQRDYDQVKRAQRAATFAEAHAISEGADIVATHDCRHCAAVEMCRQHIWQYVELPCCVPGATRHNIAQAVVNGTLKFTPMKFELVGARQDEKA
jgi:hypothetical protein